MPPGSVPVSDRCGRRARASRGVRAFVVLAVTIATAGAAAAARAEEPLRLRLESRLGGATPARAAAAVPGLLAPADTQASDAERPAFARGERIEGRAQREVTLSGDAEVRRAGTMVRADRLTYYEDDDELVAVGRVRLAREGTVITGPQLRLRLDANRGSFDSPTYSLPLVNGRGRASRAELLGPGQLALQEAVYTTCRPDSPDWTLHARELFVDQTRGEAHARGAEVHFLGRRIGGLPDFGFPIGDDRRTGFLPPSIAVNSRTGLEILAPFYVDIAPNRDLTLYPRLMLRRGVQLGAQYRYLEETYRGDARVELTPRDLVTGSSRWFAGLQHTWTDLAGWAGAANLRGVSDETYFVDYSRSILASSERSLPRDVFLSRGVGEWTLLGRVTSYQNILDARLAPPYERLPQLGATWVRREAPGGFDLASNFDASYFRRPLVAGSQLTPSGARFVVNPSVSWPVRRAGWFFTPRLSLHASAYRLEALVGGVPGENVTRVLPTASLDGGLVLERAVRWGSRDAIQTLEPRLFYVYTPYRDQRAIPRFDTGEADLNFTQLFAENTFIGNDRIADANQLTTAVVSRMIDRETGAEALRVAIGQRFYFADQRVLGGDRGVGARTDRSTDLLLAASATVGGGLRIDSGMQYAVADGSVPRFTFAARYLPGDGRILNAGVRFLRNELGQVDTSWRWPLSAHWMALGRINYSFLRNRIDPATGALVSSRPGVIESVLGLEYRFDCWALQVVAQRFVTALGATTSQFFVQLELTGLGRVGANPFVILQRNIPGYRLPNERPELPSRFFGYE